MTSKNSSELETLDDEYDRDKEIEAFQNSKLGVKGLVDSGITRIPRSFHHPPETLVDQPESYDDDLKVPIIDLSGQHEKVVQQLQDASAKFGFFQVINHGISATLLDRLIDAVKAVHELQPHEKVQLYCQDSFTLRSGVGLSSNSALSHSTAGGWRDTLSVRLGPIPFDPSALPDVCRDEVIEWDEEVKELGEKLMGLLSEGLGLSADKLTGVAYLGRRTMVAHYYPHCPEPNKTMGIASHTDPGLLTVLLQDQVGGLQVNYDGQWIDLKPVHGALVINVGDLLQIISNDQYKSGEHRVLANPFRQPRASIAVFLSSGIDENMYGPLPELVSSESPALYKEFKFSDYVATFFSKGAQTKTMTRYYRQ